MNVQNSLITLDQIQDNPNTLFVINSYFVSNFKDLRTKCINVLAVPTRAYEEIAKYSQFNNGDLTRVSIYLKTKILLAKYSNQYTSVVIDDTILSPELLQQAPMVYQFIEQELKRL